MIAAPQFQRLGTTFEFCWPMHRITLSNFRESSGDLKAELSAEVILGELWRPLSGITSINLLSTRTRSETARALNARDDTFDWHDAIEAVAVLAVQEYRKGGPIVPLRDVDAPERLRYVYEPIVPENETAIVFGDGESGKSLFCMFVAVSMANDYPLPRGVGPAKQGNVLYLDYESDPEEHARRLRKIALGLGIDVPDNIFYRQSHRPLPEEASMLAREVAERDISLVIVDSLAPACGDDPSAPGVAIATMNALRSLGASRLAIGHVNRTDREKNGANQTTFGSVFWRNMTRSMWQLVPNTDAPFGTSPFGLFNRKNNNAARERLPLGFQFVFGNDRITLEGYDVPVTSAMADGIAAADRIRAYLRSGAKNTDQIADALSLGKDHVRVTLTRMPDAQQVKPGSPGKYGTPAVWGLKARE